MMEISAIAVQITAIVVDVPIVLSNLATFFYGSRLIPIPKIAAQLAAILGAIVAVFR